MKLIRFGEPGRERPGVMFPDGRRMAASGVGGGADYDEAFFGWGGLERLARWLADAGAAAPVVADDLRLGPPICRPSKIVCVGLNYRDHARESGMAVPEEPVLFFQATPPITGPNADVIIPRHGTKLHWWVDAAAGTGPRRYSADGGDGGRDWAGAARRRSGCAGTARRIGVGRCQVRNGSHAEARARRDAVLKHIAAPS